MYLVFFTFFCVFFFFNDTPTTEIYTLSLHDALPISTRPSFITIVGDIELRGRLLACTEFAVPVGKLKSVSSLLDRKSTRLNSSHLGISYAVFCLKKKNKNYTDNKSI